ncbi:MAG TPA: DUF3617 domain-containing protein [Rhizomicrobium sp.]|jgi:hypothetical protein
MLSRIAIGGSVLVLAAIALPADVLASHGKAGLWETTTTNESAPEMSLPPEALAAMKAHGVKIPDHRSFTSQYCMTAEEVASDQPPPMRGHECKLSSSTIVGQTFSADMVCSGAVQGTSHFSVTYDSPEHFAGESEFTGHEGNQPFNAKNKFEGRWISADCGDVEPSER